MTTVYWKFLSQNTYSLPIPTKHGDIRYLLGHNALLVKSNMARWYKYTRVSPLCSKCGQEETSIHVFMCNSFGDLREKILQTLKPIIPVGASFLDLLFGKQKHCLASCFAVESLHQMWASRCKNEYDKKLDQCSFIFHKIIRAVKSCVLLSPKPNLFACELFDPSSGSFCF